MERDTDTGTEVKKEVGNSGSGENADGIEGGNGEKKKSEEAGGENEVQEDAGERERGETVKVAGKRDGDGDVEMGEDRGPELVD